MHEQTSVWLLSSFRDDQPLRISFSFYTLIFSLNCKLLVPYSHPFMMIFTDPIKHRFDIETDGTNRN